MKNLLLAVLGAIAIISLEVAANPKCHPKGCYVDYVGPECPSGQPCPAIAYAVEACPWTCGKPVPANCKERCQPCKAEVCPAVCICEKICPTQIKTP
ncbi:hypothetical protein GGI25_005292 [Coemansia spiralis]|uniref:4Fe-4S ferredoxin-type domain-containing protein n=1 Tax=Coemansia spiralis TaxID=417178 RepID=A0A9W8FYV3_9FUNG|nr:hypothetical protein GGI25_005292 [Coemansia spiralis]